MKKISLLFFLFFSFTSYSQLSKTHYIPPITTSNNQFSVAEEQYLYISTPSLTPVNFRIIQLGSATIVGTVSRNNPFSFNIGFGTNTQFIQDKNNVGSIISNKGFIVEAEAVVYVSVRLNGGGSNQAGQITSKGLAALGKVYRVGAFINTTLDSYGTNNITFASLIATENNTTINFSEFDNGVVFLNNTATAAFSITLNSGESYIVAVEGTAFANRNGLIGMKISADKDIVVNCGSTTGSNGFSNTDYGIDQLVSVERTGNEYIFIKSTGQDVVEVPLLVANETTKIFLNGNTDDLSPDFTLNAGEFLNLNGSHYGPNGNLYVRSDKNIFAYQSVGDNTRTDLANQNMFFVPPLSCETPKGIDNIPFINQVGDKVFIGRVALTTKTGSTLNFIINGQNLTIDEMPFAGYTIDGPNTIVGNANYVTYTIIGLTGNVSVYSTSELYLASMGTVGAATFGGYYSGFILKPEISFTSINPQLSNCIPNATLSVSALSSFDSYQWYLNGTPVGTNTNIYQPLTSLDAGEYYVTATNTACSITIDSDVIPVSNCPNDYENDSINDNIDLDIDNDGIPNCTESLGNFDFNFSAASPTIFSTGNYSNTITRSTNNMVTGSSTSATFYTGNGENFTTGVQAGKTNQQTVNYTFSNSISLQLTYPEIATGAPLTTNSKLTIKVPSNKTITVLNPTNQILIDTNFDGNYESGVTQFSSFEIRFILNNNQISGAGTFSFSTNLVNSITIIHENLSDTIDTTVALKLFATCIPNDTDGDGILDAFDLDSDNDGIKDLTEFLGQNPVSSSTIDANNNGIIDTYETISIADSDGDGVFNFYDLDSDNDGVYDIAESGSIAIDTNNDGKIDTTVFGTNGIANYLETSPDTSVLNYTLSNTDIDALYNYIDSDSDGDGCNDVIEAGFTDANNDTFLGNLTPTVNINNGIVTNATNGYTTPNGNYIIAAPISITTQPSNQSTCQKENATFSITTTSVDSHQWQVSSDAGVTWQNVNNSINYSGALTNSLTILKAPSSFINNLYRVVVQKNGNSCGLTSNSAALNLLALPIVNSPVTIVQCEDDETIDGFSLINLRQKEDTSLSVNAVNETFFYYKTQLGALNADVDQLISNTLNYDNTAGNTVWVRVVNATNCYAVAQLTIVVTSSQIPNSFKIEIKKCDDFITNFSEANDGITTFDFSTATQEILDELPISNSYTVSYYTNENDTLSELNPIPTLPTQGSNEFGLVGSYRNITTNMQTIWVRVDNALSNECFALGPYVKLIVTERPDIKLDDTFYICLNKPLEFLTLTAAIQDGTSTSNYSYEWFKDNVSLNIVTPTIMVNTEGIYKVIVTSIIDGCESERIITVKASDIATLQNVSINDLIDENSVVITVTGVGEYEYSIDAPNSFQSANEFTNVASGLHTFYVKDLNGCGIIGPIEISVLSFPKFFTPNGDGFNDTWNISGYDSVVNESVIIRIFDRFGKLLKQISPEGTGWDGKFNGELLPADDYWFTYDFINGRTVKGHFSLKR